jgi:hypothetical protein
MRMMIAVLMLAAACGPKITMTKTNPAPHPLRARPADSVELFTTRTPERPYVEVAVFAASKGKAEDHIDALRENAASYGCDALVFTRMPSESTVTATSGKPGEIPQSGTGTAVGSSSATCVVWTEPPPVAAPSAMDSAQPAAAPAQPAN